MKYPRITKKCAAPSCENEIVIRVQSVDLASELYHQPIAADAKKRCCCKSCQKEWQQSIPWEERVGSETAAAIRKVRREACITDNPSTRPGVAEKISKTMSQYLQENPDVRRGENNPFYGKQHSEEQKQKWSDQKKGKVAWTPEQREKHFKHVGRGETHNNWQGGISNGEYDFGFSDKLKQELKEECEYVCQLCFEKKENLSIHHIDYDKQNSSRENLIPLCNSCHSKTNYRREHWTQFFKKRK